MDIKDWTIEKIQKIDFSLEFVFDDANLQSYTYNDFFDYVLQISRHIKNMARVKKVIAVMDNSLQLFALYFCGLIENITLVPIDPQKGTLEIQKLIAQNSKDSIIIQNVKEDIFLECKLGFKTLNDNSVKKEVISKIKKRDFDADYLISFTSGTSGNIKGVRHSLADIFRTSRAFNEVHNIQEKGKFGHVFPMTYMAGILNSILKPFIFGCKIVIFNKFSVNFALSFWKKIEQYQVNIMWLSPMMLNMILKTDRGDRGIQYSRKVQMQLFVGTAPLTEQLKNLFEKKYSLKLYVSYGLTELLFLSVEDDETHDKYKNSVGKILPGVRFQELHGEGMVNTPWDFAGYTNESTELYYKEGLYKTGDLVTVKDNILFINGRKKDLIIKGGFNISSVKIENCIMEFDEIEDVAVWGDFIEGDEQIICAYVLNNVNMALGIEKKINKVLKETLGKTSMIDNFFQLRQIPYNLNGKKDVNKIREELKYND